jgi:hypothetical protein
LPAEHGQKQAKRQRKQEYSTRPRWHRTANWASKMPMQAQRGSAPLTALVRPSSYPMGVRNTHMRQMERCAAQACNAEGRVAAHARRTTSDQIVVQSPPYVAVSFS